MYDVVQNGKRLAALRGERKGEEVAAAVDITVSALYNYERGIRSPRDEIKQKLADYYGTTVGALFFNE